MSFLTPKLPGLLLSKSKKLKASIGYGEVSSPSLSLNRDHAKKTQHPMVEDEAIANQLEALLTPAITNQENYYRQLGLRDRILNLHRC